MINIGITRKPNGFVTKVTSVGHAQSNGGVSLACGIVSASLKSFGLTLAKNPLIKVLANSTGPGDLEIRIGHIPDDQQNWFRGVQEHFFQTLDICSLEFDNQIQITWKDKESDIS
jgi:uncharacterized protein YsxB (DUF464 family)